MYIDNKYVALIRNQKEREKLVRNEGMVIVIVNNGNERYGGSACDSGSTGAGGRLP